jgi:type IV pilus assembly protein PilM
MKSRFASLFTSSPPTVGVEIGARRVTAVSLGEHGGKPVVTAHATEMLPAGLVAPSLNQPNIVDRAAVSAALGRVLSQLGGRPGRVALVVPDGVAKVSLVKFDKVPAKAEDLGQMIRWQVKKSVPFPLEQAQVSWTRGATDAAGGVEFVVAIARRDIIEEYEAVCQAVNAQAGLVDLATLNLINLALIADPSLAGSAGKAGAGRAAAAQTVHDGSPDPASALPMDWVLVHVGADSSTVAIIRGAHVLFFRNRPDAEGHLNDLVHQSAMYYEDRLGGPGFSRLFVAVRDVPESQAAEIEELYRGLAERTGDRVEALDPRGAAGLTQGISPSPELLGALAAPVGVVLRQA